MNPTFLANLFSVPLSRERLNSLTARMREAGESCVLVGGAVRDALRGISVRDFDFAVTGEGLDAARQWGESRNAAIIALSEDHGTVRIRFADAMEFDFTRLRADTLEADLRLRDFTVNALAVDLNDALSGRAEILDPTNGLPDLRDGVLRWASDRSLFNDPLRILRAFRLMAEGGFRAETETARLIRENAPLLSQSAWERIREEFFRILASPRAHPTLLEMDDTGVLGVLFPELAVMKGVTQNIFHHLDVWEHTLEAIRCLEEHPVPESLESSREMVKAHLDSMIGQGIPRRALLKFALLFHDIGKPATRTEDESGRVRFIGHEKVGAEAIRVAAKRLTLSKRVTDAASLLVGEHLMTMFLSGLEERSPRTLRRFLKRLGEEWLGLLLISWADMSASRGPARTMEQTARTALLLREIVDFHAVVSATPPVRLLTGSDLLRVFGLREGPRIGRLLKEIEEAQADGLVRTQDEALRWIAKRLNRRMQSST